jgi:phosphoadenosine phosphosulfate reductase
MTEDEIADQILAFRKEGKEIFVSSSFQAHSIPLLHMVGRIDPSIPVVFLNTGFLFAETLEFRDQVVDLLGLNLIEVCSDIPKSQQRDTSGLFFFQSDPDRCCQMNKVQPMEELLWQYDVWINGVRRDQSRIREQFEIVQATPQRAVRFHPMLDWTAKDIHEYRVKHQLPAHPLEARGIFSIGCMPCTQCSSLQSGREGRWAGQQKMECGLHTELVAANSK